MLFDGFSSHISAAPIRDRNYSTAQLRETEKVHFLFGWGKTTMSEKKEGGGAVFLLVRCDYNRCYDDKSDSSALSSLGEEEGERRI